MADRPQRDRTTSGRRPLATSPFNRPTAPPPATTDGYEVGDRVTFDRLGLGRVLALSPDYLTVDFGNGTVKDIPAGAKGLSRL